MESILKHMKSHPDDYLRGHTGSDLLHDHLNWVQNKTINKNAVTNFFTNEDKARLEKNVIAEVARLRR